ncbi:unnamed protein product [Rhizoctonia solani]|uniref:BTB domain-containing protein n=1 Tax=Rhizoctonia solani TaxID=456999 RepID=A0A8H3DV48_9AGAM|nr:unnamed protein product [Rhizoctonia solani]
MLSAQPPDPKYPWFAQLPVEEQQFVRSYSKKLQVIKKLKKDFVDKRNDQVSDYMFSGYSTSSSWRLPSLHSARVSLPYPNSKMPESYIAEERLSQHSRHFYNTGDIVLQAHTVLFRVHKDVLCQHSEVFKDIFELAEPENAEDPPATPSDAVPGVVIYDNPDELALLLDFLYGN